jgi:hypothetical protein
MFSVLHQFNFNKRFALPAQDQILLSSRNLERVDRSERAADEEPPVLGVERRVGGEHRVLGAEESVAAARRRDRAVQRGVGVDHLVVVHRRTLQPGLLGLRVLLRGAEEDLVEAELDLAGVEGNHAAVVVGDDLAGQAARRRARRR